MNDKERKTLIDILNASIEEINKGNVHVGVGILSKFRNNLVNQGWECINYQLIEVVTARSLHGQKHLQKANV